MFEDVCEGYKCSELISGLTEKAFDFYNFDKLSEANANWVRGIISLLPVLIGILVNFSASFLSIMFLLDCTFL
jgi:hypothetical protein